MNDRNRLRLEAGQRCRQWILDNATIIAAGSIFETKCQALTAVVNDLEVTAGQVAAASAEGLSATDVKGSEREDLIEQLDPVRIAAKAAEPDHPGTQDRYRFSRNLPNEDLLAVGRAFALGGATDAALLVSYGAPAGWPAAITAACDAFEATFGTQASALADRIAGNAEFNEKMEEMMQLKRTISLLVRTFLAGNTGPIAAWDSAAHVETPKKKDPPPPPPIP